MFSYADFLAKVREDGLSRQNRFWVTIPGAPVIISQDTHMLCKSVSIPGVSISSAATRMTGEVYEAPYDRNFGAATLTFYTDRSLSVKRTFDEWINRIQDTQTRVIGWYQEYCVAEMDVYIDNRQDQSVFAVTLHEVYPKNIGQLSLDHQNNDVMIFDVTLQYRYYETFFVNPETGQKVRNGNTNAAFDQQMRDQFGMDGVRGI